MEQSSDVSGMDARHAAICQLVQEDKLQQAIKALLDLARDFGLHREHQRGIILCANNLRVLTEGERRYGATDSSRRERNELLDRLLRIADALQDEAKARPTSGEAYRPENTTPPASRLTAPSRVPAKLSSSAAGASRLSQRS